jgi:dihydropteroate synthase
LAAVVVEARAAVVLMHNRGTSTDMYRSAVYGDAAREVSQELAASVESAVSAGVPRDAVIVDPGIGFAKRAVHSYEIVARLDDLRTLDRPILSGPSRKSFLDEALGDRGADDREWGTAAAVAASVLAGAHIVRVHDVAHMADVVRVADHILRAARP